MLVVEQKRKLQLDFTHPGKGVVLHVFVIETRRWLLQCVQAFSGKR